jgi:Mce-associated membrane protein
MAVDADAAGQPVEDKPQDHCAETEGAVDTDSQIEEIEQPKHGSGRMRAAFAVALVALAALIGIGAWTFQQNLQDRHADQRRAMLVGAARQAALNLTTIDHATVDADIKRILDSSTGSFHDDFEKRADPFVQAVTEEQSKSVGTVTEAGLESQDENGAQVLVSVAVKTALAGVEDPQPRAWRMRITVTEPDGRDAKVSNVQFVS